MLTTVIFRLHPSESQIPLLNEIFTIYNRMKRRGYQLLFTGKSGIQQKLMQVCHNNPYVNTIMIENQTKLEQQKTWLEKRENYLHQKIEVVKGKIARTKEKTPKDRSLKGLYALLSSLQNRVAHLILKPVVFGTKSLFRERIRGKISRTEFIIRRDASFCCIGKAQGGVQNNNLKILPSDALRISTFHKAKGTIPKRIRVPLAVNPDQRSAFQEILQLDKYTVVVKRQFIKGELRYYTHVSYETPEPNARSGFQNGAIGLDFNYNFFVLVNIDRDGHFLSYQLIPFRNLHTFRKGRRHDYASFKLEKVINYCLNKGKGVIIEDLSFDQSFSYNKKRNRKINQLKTSMLPLLERKCMRKGIAIKKIHPAYTSIIGELKYSRSFNLSRHVLASYVIARKGLGFTEDFPAFYKRLLAQVGGVLKPRLNPSSPYYQWAQLYDLFKQCGITSFNPSKTPSYKPAAIVKKLMMNGANPATGTQPDNLTAGLLACG
ncbi:MAG: IS200/IS605 family element transposase accessory protein TnpB [Candidatus Helarchaeota archaeon]|nr:IS200/IS605 family element transposase accessory protein TnpB [Candidatus Helarchaeota archaeon]